MADPAPTPLDVGRGLADPATYDEVILRIFEKRRQRGQAYTEALSGVTYCDTATGRRSLSRALARSVGEGDYHPQPVALWSLETGGKTRDAHESAFTDHVVGSALYQLLSRNARCYGLPGVYSYLPGISNSTAMRAFATFVRRHRTRVGAKGAPLYVLQSDFDHYGDGLPVGPDAPVWPILREVASLGSPDGVLPDRHWTLICELARPVVRDSEGALFTRRYGVAMGTPLVPLLSNLAVTPMDRAIVDIDGMFYARYNDDFILAHPDLAALQQADARIDALVGRLGVRRKGAKELRTALSATGMPAPDDPAYSGRNRIDCLGLSVSHAGAMAVGPHRLHRFMHRLSTRIDFAARSVAALPAHERAQHLVAATNVMLDVGSPFCVPGLSALLEATTDRGVLADLDFRVARKIVQSATGRRGVLGFRVIAPRTLHEMGLVSLVKLRNLR